ncbi:MAG: NAD-dependent malic enzyme [Gammaproteobacteria bacterium CG11_big_fil_rev_8_21_14_0_20_46_22]|nr:MAG: NAD-dependent malic enzyme [Gammaproteobacteria bacterium CG12_big_fil_rev_8_21_14_0_65_46_12]PIR10765.1 MAG: NAD-dependent malic enzyme [Gammaproteobacteria bacterium CG11_big_fil_rev_8_21_14_0_20_46_22]
MLDYTLKTDKNGLPYLETPMVGGNLLAAPQLNKGTAFTNEERHAFELKGKLPSHVETLSEQVARAYFQFQTQNTRLRKNMYLHALHESNRVIFYKLVDEHLAEMLPLLYTPMVSTVVKIYSQKFRHPRGLYITYEDRDCIEEILRNRTNPMIDVIVATDGEGVLGIGDQGLGGMEIAVAKLMVYTLCGYMNPLKTLPLFLDVGTNNPLLLNDPMYLGWRQPRISPKEYDEFIEKFVQAVKNVLPGAFLHWEDLGRENASRVINHYRDKLPTFNDDIEGTSIVTLSALLSALKQKGSQLCDEQIVIFGAGSAGCGIAKQLAEAIAFYHNKPIDEARAHIWLIDRQGLICDDMDTLTSEQQPFGKSRASLGELGKLETIALADVIEMTKAGVLIGCSGQTGAFSEAIVGTMIRNHTRPIIFPLSNPTPNAEAHPARLLEWTQGQALIATGSPFGTVRYNDNDWVIAQCNNALVFPGIGLGIAMAKPPRLSKAMLFNACETLSEENAKRIDNALLPSICDSKPIALAIAKRVAQTAIDEGLAAPFDIDEALKAACWTPAYLPYKHRG